MKLLQSFSDLKSNMQNIQNILVFLFRQYILSISHIYYLYHLSVILFQQVRQKS